MNKLLLVPLLVLTLSACSSMAPAEKIQPNSGATKNSTDANRSNNPAAVSPGPGAR